MKADARKIVVIDARCGACGTDHLEVYHEHFPELRVVGASGEEAVKRLLTKLELSLSAVSDPFHCEPAREAITDVQAFLNRTGAAHPARDL